MTTRYLDDQPVGGPELEFIPAKLPGLRDPVEAGLKKSLVHFRRVGAAFIRFVLLFPQQAAHSDRPFEKAIGCHVGFGLWDWRGSGGGRYIQVHVACSRKALADDPTQSAAREDRSRPIGRAFEFAPWRPIIDFTSPERTRKPAGPLQYRSERHRVRRS